VLASWQVIFELTSPFDTASFDAPDTR